MKIVLISLVLVLCSSLKGGITSEVKTLEQRKESQLRKNRRSPPKSEKIDPKQRNLKDQNMNFVHAYKGTQKQIKSTRNAVYPIALPKLANPKRNDSWTIYLIRTLNFSKNENANFPNSPKKRKTVS